MSAPTEASRERNRLKRRQETKARQDNLANLRARMVRGGNMDSEGLSALLDGISLAALAIKKGK